MTTKLILSLDGTVLREVLLNQEKLTIGRKQHNDLHIDNLAVSGHHAVITQVIHDVFLEDLNSTNGTQVNGKPIEKHLLQDGDVIEIGKYRLKFLRSDAEKGSVGPQEDIERTMVIRPGTIKPAYAASTVDDSTATQPNLPAQPSPIDGHTGTASAAAEGNSQVAALRVLTGVNTGKSLDLTKNITSIGKPGVQVAIISRRPTGFFIAHVEGATQPSVNGVQIGLQAHALSDHDKIDLAGIQMEFFYK